MIDRVVIIGHNGFIGTKVAKILGELYPNIEIVGISAPDVDITTSAGLDAAKAVITNSSAILMLAGIKRQLGDSADIFAKNIAISTAFDKLLEITNPRRIVYLSSGAVYGEDIENININEATPTRARSFYGLSKIAAEFLLENYAQTHQNCSLSVLRPATLYGPGDVETAYGPVSFLHNTINSTDFALWGEGDELRELIYIDDAVEIIAKCVLNFEQIGILNIVSGISYTFKEALEAVEKVTRQKPVFISKARSKPKIDNRYDNSAVKVLFPKFVFTSLENGIRKMAQIRYGLK